jgi:hypothetical protein
MGRRARAPSVPDNPMGAARLTAACAGTLAAGPHGATEERRCSATASRALPPHGRTGRARPLADGLGAAASSMWRQAPLQAAAAAAPGDGGHAAAALAAGERGAARRPAPRPLLRKCRLQARGHRASCWSSGDPHGTCDPARCGCVRHSRHWSAAASTRAVYRASLRP